MKYCLFAVLLTLAVAARAQNDRVEQLALDFFNAVKFNDTAAFNRCFIDNKDLNRIMYHYVRHQDSVSKDSISEVIMPDMDEVLAKQFATLKQRFRDSGVSWTNARYVNCFYNLLKDKSSVYPSLTGEMIFESGGRRYSIIFGSAVYIAGAWKLVSFRLDHTAAATRPGVSYFLEKDGFFNAMSGMDKKGKQPVKTTAPVKLSSGTPSLYKKPAVKLQGKKG